MIRRMGGGLLALILFPDSAAAAGQLPVDLPVWTVAPFVLLLAGIALLPLLAEHFWHSNFNKALVAALLTAPVVVYLLSIGQAAALRHELEQYVSFIILLGSLYTISGGIVVEGDIQGKPLTNTGVLAVGAVLANLIGTTGASMLLIRPFLRINRQRQHTRHLPVFFIFIVSNLGGLLTPLGDPPLFLGFLNGVDFFWTLSLWPQWLTMNGIVLAVFVAWESLAYRRETVESVARDVAEVTPLRVRGLVNLALLAGVSFAVLMKSPEVGGRLGRLVGVDPQDGWWGEGLMVLLALASLAVTPAGIRAANQFGWGAITEVAVLFAGIFIAMVPALMILEANRAAFGSPLPWEYFWMTGGLSSFLDNAPTYMVFATLAAGSPEDIGALPSTAPLLLQAVSCGAVFMGANTYIGNGPNFMVKAIADEAGYRTPSFFGYMLYSSLILLPTFVLITFVFFPLG